MIRKVSQDDDPVLYNNSPAIPTDNPQTIANPGQNEIMEFQIDPNTTIQIVVEIVVIPML